MHSNVLRAGNGFIRRDQIKDAYSELSFIEGAVHEFLQSSEQVRNIFMVEVSRENPSLANCAPVIRKARTRQWIMFEANRPS